VSCTAREIGGPREFTEPPWASFFALPYIARMEYLECLPTLMNPWAKSTCHLDPRGAACVTYRPRQPHGGATAAGHAPTARPSLQHAQIIQQLCNTPPPRTTWTPRLQLGLDRARSVRWPSLTVSLHADGWQVDAEVDKLEETLRAAVRPTPKSAHHRTALGPVQSLFFFALRGAHRRASTVYVGRVARASRWQ